VFTGPKSLGREAELPANSSHRRSVIFVFIIFISVYWGRNMMGSKGWSRDYVSTECNV
jgi:hypothetical protein